MSQLLQSELFLKVLLLGYSIIAFVVCFKMLGKMSVKVLDGKKKNKNKNCKKNKNNSSNYNNNNMENYTDKLNKVRTVVVRFTILKLLFLLLLLFSLLILFIISFIL